MYYFVDLRANRFCKQYSQTNSLSLSCSIIVDKIDKNRDQQVTQEELEDWVRHVARRYVYDDVDNVWDYHDLNKDGYIDLAEYQNVSFGVIEGETMQPLSFAAF